MRILKLVRKGKDIFYFEATYPMRILFIVSQWRIRTEGANGRYKKCDGMKLCREC